MQTRQPDTFLKLYYPDEITEETKNKLYLDQTYAGIRYRIYRDMLFDIRGEPGNRYDISHQLIGILKSIVTEAFMDFGLRIEDLLFNNSINLCITGSLVKNMATPFSDIDSFMIISDDLDESIQRTVKEAMAAAFQLAQLLFLDTNQFGMDVIGLNIKNMTGTIDQLNSIINSQMNICNNVSMTNAVSILQGDEKGSLLIKLKESLKSSLVCYACKVQRISIDWKFYFNYVINEFSGPNLDKNQYLVKSDILRPIDFLIDGFRMLAQLRINQDETTEQLLIKLVKSNIIDDTTSRLLLYLVENGYNLRNKLHNKHNAEYEVISADDVVIEIVMLIAILRGELHRWLEQGAKGCFTFHVDGFLSAKEWSVIDGNEKLVALQACERLSNSLLIIQDSFLPEKTLFNTLFNSESNKAKMEIMNHSFDLINKIKNNIINSIISNSSIDINKELLLIIDSLYSFNSVNKILVEKIQGKVIECAVSLQKNRHDRHLK